MKGFRRQRVASPLAGPWQTGERGSQNFHSVTIVVFLTQREFRGGERCTPRDRDRGPDAPNGCTREGYVVAIVRQHSNPSNMGSGLAERAA